MLMCTASCPSSIPDRAGLAAITYSCASKCNPAAPCRNGNLNGNQNTGDKNGNGNGNGNVLGGNGNANGNGKLGSNNGNGNGNNNEGSSKNGNNNGRPPVLSMRMLDF